MERKKFIHHTTLGLTGAILFPKFGSLKRMNPLNKINIGVIGCNGMGWSNTNSFLNMERVDLLGICDVDDKVISRRLEDFKKKRPNQQLPKTYKNYEQLLADRSIDVVIIGTPDHWHCKMTCDALDAGKHVYCEKPLANSIEECKIMIDAKNKSGKMVQVGQWQRSGAQYRKADEMVNSGLIGKIRLVKCWAYQAWMKPLEVKPDGPVPEGIDYQSWLGPAQKRPFNPNRFHFNFRWFWDYAGGLMTDWGVHEIDIALMVMGVKAPKSIMASGGKQAYPNDAAETPDTLQTVFNYGDFNMLWEHATGIDGGPYGRNEGIAFIGNKGTIVVNRGGYELIPEKEWIGWGKTGSDKIEPIPNTNPTAGNPLDLHTQNLIVSIESGDPNLLNCPIEQGAISAINAQMGNIAYKVGEKIHWDASKGKFDNKKANQLISPTYHNGYKLPTY